MSEAVVQQQARLELARTGGLIWRNNVGACTDDTGRMIRYGLCNDSAQMNRSIASSDLIGVTPMVIGPEHVGRTIGVFTAVECKRRGWRLTPADARGHAQAKFIALVKSVGGIAGFVSDPSHIKQLLDNW